MSISVIIIIIDILHDYSIINWSQLKHIIVYKLLHKTEFNKIVGCLVRTLRECLMKVKVNLYFQVKRTFLSYNRFSNHKQIFKSQINIQVISKFSSHRGLWVKRKYFSHMKMFKLYANFCVKNDFRVIRKFSSQTIFDL